jgi:hypothetical protein
MLIWRRALKKKQGEEAENGKVLVGQKALQKKLKKGVIFQKMWLNGLINQIQFHEFAN